MQLTLAALRTALEGRAAAFRCITSYQPAGGRGAKVFPPTYEGGKYATEQRVHPGRHDPDTGAPRESACVLLDSVQSQANRMESALLEAQRAGRIELPLLITRFDHDALPKPFSVNSLEAPHRVADALFRDSTLDGVIFRQSEAGRILDTSDVRNAAGLFGLCPTALVFGIWDSTGPRPSLGAKFQRALVSEIVGYDAVQGKRTRSRIDPAQVVLGAGPLYSSPNDSNEQPHWTLDSKSGGKKLGKDGKGKPSEANHGNVTPSVSDGGFTISEGVQTTVLSLAALRRLRFPLAGASESDRQIDIAAQTALAAIGLAAAALAREDGDLRSRCQLFPESESCWELLDRPGHDPQSFELTPGAAIDLLNQSVDAAKQAGLPWQGVIELQPSEQLVELVRRSQELASAEGGESD